jgi:hypothetical protein
MTFDTTVFDIVYFSLNRTQYNGPPPSVVLNVDLRNHECQKLLVASRRRFVESENTRKMSKRVGVFGAVSIDNVRKFLLGKKF